MRRNANFNTIIFVFRLMFFQKHTCLVEFCYAKFIAARHNIEILSCFSLFCARLVEFCYAKFIAVRHNMKISSRFSLFCARLVEFSKRLAEISTRLVNFCTTSSGF